MTRKPNGAVWSCIAAGFLAYLLLPWYAIQDTSWYQALPQAMALPEATLAVVGTTAAFEGMMASGRVSSANRPRAGKL